jgi:hypothetical protein
VTDARPNASLLLEGLQEGMEGTEAGGLAEDEVDDWEMIAVLSRSLQW